MKKTDSMRRVEFRFADRMAVAPVELAQAWPFMLGALGLSFLGALPLASGFAHRLAWLLGGTLGSILVGSLAFPALLPLLPPKAFSVKGAVLGLLWGLACAFVGALGWAMGTALVLASTATVSFIALNFTGASTYTCQSGANLEVEKSILPIIASLVIGLGLGGAARIFGF